MLLDLVATRLFAALQQSTADEHTDDDGDDNNNSVDKLLHRFGALLTPVYEQLAAMSAVFESAGALRRVCWSHWSKAVSLHTKAHVYYVGCDSLGILGLIDASECPPTFGAQFDDIRCACDQRALPLTDVVAAALSTAAGMRCATRPAI